jgi:hypothetical protein
MVYLRASLNSLQQQLTTKVSKLYLISGIWAFSFINFTGELKRTMKRCIVPENEFQGKG